MQHIGQISTIKQFTNPPVPPQPDTGSISTFPTAPLDIPPNTFESALKNRQENQHKLIQWIKQNLEPDIHYGRVHVAQNCPLAKAGASYLCRDFSHFSSLMLFKAGAEKIIAAMGLTAHFPNVYQYEEACLRGLEIRQVLIKCELKTHGGRIVAEGSGGRHLHQEGHTTDRLNRLIHERFNKHLDDLNRVEASRFIEYING